MVDKKNKPIYLDYAKLRDFMRNGYIRCPQNAYIGNDFAVLRSIRNMKKYIFSFNQPYRLPELRVGRVVSGWGRVNANLIDYDFHAGMLIYLKGGSIIQPLSFSDDFDMEAVSVSDDLLPLLFNGRVPSCFVSGATSNLINIPQSESEIIHRMIDMLWDIVHHTEFGAQVSCHLLTSVLCVYQHVYDRTLSKVRSSTSREQATFLRFINLVHQYSKTERSLSFYADKMCLSQHYLGTLVRSASGYTPKEWIERSVVSEAKVMLKYTDLLTYQIADDLNFPNVSFFCKFFKRITGLTPLEYQRS